LSLYFLPAVVYLKLVDSKTNGPISKVIYFIILFVDLLFMFMIVIDDNDDNNIVLYYYYFYYFTVFSGHTPSGAFTM